MQVIKRDGSKQKFDEQKIWKAILGCFEDCCSEGEYVNDDVITELTNKVTQQLDKRKNYNVEQIQDIVELTLMEADKYEQAKAYIEYRQLHKLARNSYAELMNKVKAKLEAKNVENSNANLDENTFSGREKEAFGTILKEYALNNLVSETTRNNHINNEIYIHDLDAYASGMHNCFDSFTEFITSDGIRQFRQFSDGEAVTVLDKNGVWRDATVHCYGHRKVQEVLLEYHGSKKDLDIFSIKCTKDHRWILKDGTVTTNLKIGDKLWQLPATQDFNNINIISKRDAEMWCLGFIIGDGCDHGDRTQVLLCGNKSRYVDNFKKASYNVKEISGPNKFYCEKRLYVQKQQFLTNKMWKLLNTRDKQLLFMGYICSDGNFNNKSVAKSCCTADERVLEFVKDLSCLCGYHVRRVTSITHDTNFKLNAHLWVIDFITHQNHTGYWQVKDIINGTHNNSSIWCVEEPCTHSFTLAGGIVTGNCLSIPLDDLLEKGFKVKQTDVRPAGSINTAMQLAAVIMQLQSLCQFGGVSYTHFDWSMVPYVRKSFSKHYKDGLKYVDDFHINERNDEIDYEIEHMLNNTKEYSIEDSEYKSYSPKAYKYAIDMTKKEIHQSVEALYHNLNSLQSRSGQQLPFSSINYGTCTLPEGRMITEELLNVSIEGLGKYHRTSIFPCGIFQCMKGVNRKPGDPNYDLFQLALKSTSKRLYPNYANVDWSGNIGYDVNDPKTYFSTMGCRTANGWDINGLKQQKDGRGNVTPTTIILPMIAMKSKECTRSPEESDIDVFMRLLECKINEAKDSLIERFEHICSQSPKSAPFMYENNTMAGYIPEEGIRSALKHGTLAIGQLGLAECLQILIGKDHTTKEGMELAKKIEQLFKDKCAYFKEQYKLNFGVYYTPAESLCKTAMTKFKEKYGVIPNVSDRKYFTNSMHVPVYHNINAFDKINIESQLTGYSSAGCITYVELDSSSIHNIEAIEKLVNYAMDKDIPYFAINVPNDVCMNCGHQEEMNDKCPECGSDNIERLRRVTGYVSTDYHNFNEGKIAEVEDRVKHTGVPIE